MGAIAAGGALGLLLRKGLPERFKEIIVQALGLAVMIVGLSGVLIGLYRVMPDGKLDRQYLMLMIFSLVIGGVLGELINIEGLLNRVGGFLEKKLVKGEGTFAKGFVTASLVFCVGAMAIVGSLEDGLSGNAEILFAKSILDGVISVVFAATMGAGVLFSAVSVFIYQGSITLLARLISPLLTDVIVTQMSVVGSILILGIGMNLLGFVKIRVGNLLPAVFVPVVWNLILAAASGFSAG
jgi:uncharacterized membrane protein YqgA involved in biofilm formation